MYYRAIAPLVANASPATALAIYKLLDLPNVPKAGTNYYLKVSLPSRLSVATSVCS